MGGGGNTSARQDTGDASRFFAVIALGSNACARYERCTASIRHIIWDVGGKGSAVKKLFERSNRDGHCLHERNRLTTALQLT